MCFYLLKITSYKCFPWYTVQSSAQLPDLTTVSTNARDIRSGWRRRERWALVSARRCRSTRSSWISGLFGEPCIPDASLRVLATSSDQRGLLTYPRLTAFLWRHLKAEACANKPRTLKTGNRISETKSRCIDKLSLRAAMINFRSWSQECIACQTGHLRDVTSKK